MIADAITDILSTALPAHVIPPKPRFSYKNVPACDAEIPNVYCEFEAAGLLFSLHFELDTDRGGSLIFLEPKPRPSVDGASLTCEGMAKTSRPPGIPIPLDGTSPCPLADSSYLSYILALRFAKPA